jgi:ABC-type multidrug transport system ATPase subunit
MLVVEGLRKRFGNIVALDGFALTVGPGEVMGLVGHNGAGKTTFARAVAGLVSLDGGRVCVAGIDIARYTTHYLPELEVLGASVAVVKAGRVIARGSRAELLASLPGRAVLRYDGIPPALAPQASEAAKIHVDGSDVTILARDPAACVATLLARHAEDVHRLRSIELSPPTLDDLYRQLLQPMGCRDGI